MATRRQTTYMRIAKLLRYIIFYILSAVKLYFIGAVALLSQLLERPVFVKGLPRLSGKTAVVTGGGAGIGFHVSKQLAQLGARVIIATRSKVEGERSVAHIRKDWPSADVTFMELDLASFQSVKKFASDFLAKGWPLHILINNAGVMLVPYQLTDDGYEYHLQVNFLSHALLISLLKNTLVASAAEGSSARVINLSSVVHYVACFDARFFTQKQDNDWSYSPHNAYALSKLVILFYTYALCRQWAAENINLTINAVHPGVVNTLLYRHIHWSIAWAFHFFRWLLFMNVEKASTAVVYLAASQELNGVSGQYFFNSQRIDSSSTSKLCSLQDDLYKLTQDILGKKLT